MSGSLHCSIPLANRVWFAVIKLFHPFKKKLIPHVYHPTLDLDGNIRLNILPPSARQVSRLSLLLPCRPRYPLLDCGER